jgi:hypothetical protein
MQSVCKRGRVHLPWIFLKRHQSYETVSVYLIEILCGRECLPHKVCCVDTRHRKYCVPEADISKLKHQDRITEDCMTELLLYTF